VYHIRRTNASGNKINEKSPRFGPADHAGRHEYHPVVRVGDQNEKTAPTPQYQPSMSMVALSLGPQSKSVSPPSRQSKFA